jgi:hypothetical protein
MQTEKGPCKVAVVCGYNGSAYQKKVDYCNGHENILAKCTPCSFMFDICLQLEYECNLRQKRLCSCPKKLVRLREILELSCNDNCRMWQISYGYV